MPSHSARNARASSCGYAKACPMQASPGSPDRRRVRRGHLPQPEDQRVGVPQQRHAVARRELGKVALQPCPRARETLAHPCLECQRGLARNVGLHAAEAARGQRKERGLRGEMREGDLQQVVDGDRGRALEEPDQRAEVAVDVALVQREQQLVLAREIEVDGALGEARLVRDLGDIRDALGRARQQRSAASRIACRRSSLPSRSTARCRIAIASPALSGRRRQLTAGHLWCRRE